MVFQRPTGIRIPPIFDVVVDPPAPSPVDHRSMCEIDDDFKPFSAKSGKKRRAGSKFSALLNCAARRTARF
jgi:hypothetical protein